VIAVVVSRADHASEHIGERLLALADWTEHEDDDRPDAAGGGAYYRTDGFELREFDTLHLELEHAAEAFSDPDLLVFASRHSGDTGPLLTAHHTGNVGPAEFGGEDDALAEAAPNALARVHEAFRRHAPEGYDVGLECTHHGPSEVGVPSLFAELGSGEDEWNDPAGAEAVARAVLALRDVPPHRDRQLAGFGGGHYVPRFERVVRETDWAVGHVAADWSLDALGDHRDHRDVLRQVLERSRADVALVEGEHPGLADVLEALDYRVVSETWVRETSGVPLALVADLERRLGRIGDGLRFGKRASGDAPDGDDVRASDLPADLLAEANGIDRERVRAAVHERSVAYDTAEGGTLVSGPVALVDGADREVLVDALADVLRAKYDEVERRGDRVVARRRAFDPAKARERGVPEGPAFGRLADGQSVEVDGRTVDPADVVSDETYQFDV
jgi:D-aminoacyl-tRNA deacylase